MKSIEDHIQGILHLELAEGDLASLRANLDAQQKGLKRFAAEEGISVNVEDIDRFNQSYALHGLTALRAQSIAAQSKFSLASIISGETVIRCLEERLSELETISIALLGHSVDVYLEKNPQIVDELCEEALKTNLECGDSVSQNKQMEVALFLAGEIVDRGIDDQLLSQLVPNR